jgi:hypothetical protein
MKDNEKMKGSKGSTANKVKKLKDQYNKILIDLFDQYAAECVEEAISDATGSFGENIANIVETAICNLKEKVLGELGISCECDQEVGGVAVMSMGFEAPDIDDFDMEDESDSDEPMSFEKEYEKNDDDDEEELEEKTSQGGKIKYMMKRNIIKEAACKCNDKFLSNSRRKDQQILTEAYANMMTVSEK